MQEKEVRMRKKRNETKQYTSKIQDSRYRRALFQDEEGDRTIINVREGFDDRTILRKDPDTREPRQRARSLAIRPAEEAHFQDSNARPLMVSVDFVGSFPVTAHVDLGLIIALRRLDLGVLCSGIRIRSLDVFRGPATGEILGGPVERVPV